MKYCSRAHFNSVLEFPREGKKRDSILATANIENLQSVIPEIKQDENFDVVPFALSLWVANMVNRNDDGVTGEESLKVFKNLVNKPVDLEHDRKTVIGVITTVGLADFETEEEITEEQARNSDEPFNITIGGVLWRMTDEDLIEEIEESGDPESPNFLKYSGSFEVLFNEISIALLDENEKKLKNGIIVNDNSEIIKLKKFLRSEGGPGKLEDGTRVYRIIKDFLPVGAGIVESPAAFVKGLLTDPSDVSLEVVDEDQGDNLIKNNVNSSQLKKDNVIQNEHNFIVSNIMKRIKKVEDLTQEVLQKADASDLQEFIHEKIDEAGKAYVAERDAKAKEAQELQTKISELEKSQKEATDAKEAVEKKVGELEQKAQALEKQLLDRDKQDKFNSRMASLDEKYDLDDDDRKVIAEAIRGLDDEAYTKYESNVSVLLRNKVKVKGSKPAQAAETTDDEPDDTSAAEVVEASVAGAKPESTVPATTQPAAETWHEKAKRAFAKENFKINYRK